jgi:hypothetical protein
MVRKNSIRLEKRRLSGRRKVFNRYFRLKITAPRAKIFFLNPEKHRFTAFFRIQTELLKVQIL